MTVVPHLQITPTGRSQGFTRKGKIAFDHRDNSQELRFPSVSTCQPMLQLPMCDDLTQDYDSFKEKMNLAVLGSVGFGNP